MISHTQNAGETATTSQQGSPGQPAPTHPASEQYSALLSRVLDHQQDLSASAYALGVTSSHAGEGVTTTAINLSALAAGCPNRRVLLIDCAGARRRGGPAERLGLTPTCGLSDALSGAALLGDCLISTRFDRLSFLAGGREPGGLGHDYDPAAFRALLSELKGEFDFVVVDLPAVDSSSNCTSMARLLDGVVLVIEAGRTDARHADRAQQKLRTSGAALIGAVLNRTR
ncbi:MAG: CpsD/CapB family tyrosine-protein kinase [Planctomycetota bacterium]